MELESENMADISKDDATVDSNSTTSPVMGVKGPDLVDLYNLLIIDSNDLSVGSVTELVPDDILLAKCRDAAQLLLNDIFALPTKRVDNVLCLEMPSESKYVLPREKTLPGPKVLTKWQQFALSKGIATKAGAKQAKKRRNLTWDEPTESWIPKYGAKRAANEASKNWMVELANGDDMTEGDPFDIESRAKRERVSKNEVQRLKNVARASKLKSAKHLAIDADANPARQSSASLASANQTAFLSTASLGKFQPQLHHSSGHTKLKKSRVNKMLSANQKAVITKLNKVSATAAKSGVKRKFDSVYNTEVERQKNLAILDSLAKPAPLDTTRVKTVRQAESRPSKAGKKAKRGASVKRINKFDTARFGAKKKGKTGKKAKK